MKTTKKQRTHKRQSIPTTLSKKEFKQFVSQLSSLEYKPKEVTNEGISSEPSATSKYSTTFSANCTRVVNGFNCPLSKITQENQKFIQPGSTMPSDTGWLMVHLNVCSRGQSPSYLNENCLTLMWAALMGPVL